LTDKTLREFETLLDEHRAIVFKTVNTYCWRVEDREDQKNECEPMFLSFFILVGVFLLLAARRPSEYRSVIALAAWWSISHGTVMAIQTVEAWNHGVHRNFTDVFLFLVIGIVLLALPAKRFA
jgi:hypothetical protein